MEDITKEYQLAKKNLITGVNNRQGICETLRLVYDYVYELPKGEVRQNMTHLLVEAFVMGKKMADRLAYYQRKYKDESGSKGTHIRGLTNVRKRCIIRKSRIIE